MSIRPASLSDSHHGKPSRWWLVSTLTTSHLGALVLGAVMVLLLQDQFSLPALLAWYALIGGMLLARWIARGRFIHPRQPDRQQRRQFHIAMLLGTLFSGAIWAIPALLFFPADSSDRLFITMIIGTMCAIAVITLLHRWQYALLFCALAATPWAVRLVVAEGWAGVELGGLVLLNFLPMVSLMLMYRREAMEARSGAIRLRNTETQLAQHQRRAAAVFDHVADGILIINASGVVLGFNPAAEKLFGYQASEVVGGSLSLLLADEFLQDFNRFLQAKNKLDFPLLRHTHVITGRRAHGQALWLEITVNSYVAEDEILFIGVVRDVSELRRTHIELARTNAEMRSLFDAAQIGIVSVGLDGRVARFNRGAERLLGYSAAEVIGKYRPLDFHVREEVTALERQISAARGVTVHGGRIFLEPEGRRRHWTYVRRDGSQFIGDGISGEIRGDDGEIIGYLGLIMDVTNELEARRAETQARAQLEAFIENAPIAVAMFDNAMRHLAYSRCWQHDFCKGRELRGVPIYEVDPMIEPHWRPICERALAGSVEICPEGLVPKPDGTQMWMHWELRPWHNADGSIGGLIALVENIDERKRQQLRTQDLVERFALAANAAGIGVWEWDWSTREFRWDLNMYQIYGIEPGSRVGFDEWRSWIHPEDISTVDDEMRKAYATGKPFDAEIRFVRNDAREIYVRASATVVRDDDGNILRLIGIQMDNTRVHLAERMKSEFVATVSHELRTPLTSIRGSLGLLAGGAAGELPPRARQLVSIAHDNSERLLLLVNDILDISRIEAGNLAMVIERTPLLPLLQRSMRNNEGFVNALDVRLQLLDVDARMRSACAVVDTHRVLQVLANLISNAAKFSRPGGLVELALVAVDSERGAFARIEVRDRGPGIASEFRDRIFQKFSQADSSDTRVKGGTGLGLAISKMLVERLNGKIGFYLREGGGTAFYVELPIARDDVERCA